MNLESKKIIIVLFILVLTSPWFNIFLKNRRQLLPLENINKINHQQILLDETNTLRGEMENVTNKYFARALVNKFTVRAFDYTDLYFQNFDPHYLFFVGTNDETENTGFDGPLYLTLLPLFLYGLYKSKNKFLKVLLVISPFLTLYYLSPKSLVLNIPLFILISIFASIGFVNMYKNKKAISIFLISYFIFEFAKFFHNFNNHF